MRTEHQVKSAAGIRSTGLLTIDTADLGRADKRWWGGEAEGWEGAADWVEEGWVRCKLAVPAPY